MTIKDSLKAQFRENDYLSLGSWVLLFILNIINIRSFALLELFLFLAFGGTLIQMMLIPCPECKSSVFWTSMKNGPFIERVPDKCASCGCNYLDEINDQSN